MVINVYMDFDGVINPITPRGPVKTGWDRWRTAKVQGYRIIWSRSLIEAIREVEALPGVTIKWLTTWTDDAPAELSPHLGIGRDWPVLGVEAVAGRPDGYGVNWWKLIEVQKDIEQTKPDKIIWIDDDLVAERYAMVYAESLPNMLTVSPMMRLGLTQEHLAEIKSFITG